MDTSDWIYDLNDLLSHIYHKKITNWHRKLIGTKFTLPKTIKIKDFIKSAIVFTIIMEIIGALLLMFIGRVGMLTFGFALIRHKQQLPQKIIDDDLAV